MDQTTALGAVVGLVAPYNSVAFLSGTAGSEAKEFFAPGCFDAAVEAGATRLQLNHEKRLAYGSQRDGALTLFTQSPAGLVARLDLDRLADRAAAEGIRDYAVMGRLGGWSVGLLRETGESAWVEASGTRYVEHTRCSLVEVSLIVDESPAYIESWAGLLRAGESAVWMRDRSYPSAVMQRLSREARAARLQREFRELASCLFQWIKPLLS